MSLIRIFLVVLLGLHLMMSSVAAAGVSWNTIASWKGDGSLTTEVFSVPVKDWRVVWESRDENGDTGFQIYVYRENGDMVALIDNVSREAANPLFLYEAGRYYLKINASRPFYVNAEAKY
jgi:hypothetical protein